MEALKSEECHPHLKNQKSELLEPYTKFLIDRGVPKDEAEEKADRLKRDRPKTIVEEQKCEEDGCPATSKQDVEDAEAVFGLLEENAVQGEELIPVDASSSPPTSDPISTPAPKMRYWIGNTFHTRRLHRINGCPSSHNTTNMKFVDCLSSAEYNAVCKKCFKYAPPDDEVSSEEESSSSEGLPWEVLILR